MLNWFVNKVVIIGRNLVNKRCKSLVVFCFSLLLVFLNLVYLVFNE